MASKPWDSRIAYWLVQPLKNSSITPNQLTLLSLLTGLGAATLFASGQETAVHWGAAIYMLAALIDHADGELARLTGKTSRFGFYFDQFTGAVNYITLFVGIGIGLRHGFLENWAIPMGLVAGIAVSITLHLRFRMEQQAGKKATQQPHFAGFEIEDCMYLIGPITWLGGLQPFLLAASLGAPLFAGWTLLQYRKDRQAAAHSTTLKTL